MVKWKSILILVNFSNYLAEILKEDDYELALKKNKILILKNLENKVKKIKNSKEVFMEIFKSNKLNEKMTQKAKKNKSITLEEYQNIIVKNLN